MDYDSEHDSAQDFMGVKNSSMQDWNQTNKNTCLLTLLQIQNKCNLELLKNQFLISQLIMVEDQKEKEQKGFSQTSASSKNQKPESSQSKKINEPKGLRKKRKANNSLNRHEQSEYEPEQQDDYQCAATYKISESKNIPKSFGKSILTFIKKNSDLTKAVLKNFDINFEDFQKVVQSYKGNINSILELRSLWVDELHPYGRAFRVLSNIYLKKHSLGHIFNSRIENHGKHLKYRNKIMEGIEKPEEFTYMKDY